MRRGVTPVVGAVIMLLIIAGIATSAVVYLQDASEQVIGGTEQVALETSNVTCQPSTITWWIANTDEYGVQPQRGDILIYDSTGLNDTLSQTNTPIDAGFLSAYTTDNLTISLTTPLALGETYDLALAVGDATVEASCRTGAAWWNTNWQYRRAITTPTATPTTLNITIDTSALIANGQLRADCADIRITNQGNTTFHEITQCIPDAHILANVTQLTPGDAYLYYGNLQATDTNTTLQQEPLQTATLGPEEQRR